MAPLFNKTLVLIRHAHRDKIEGREKDNGISKKGRKQAEAICAHFEEHFDLIRPRLLTSAKVRCVETLKPIAALTNVRLEVDPLLMEQGGESKTESFAAVQKRVKHFCENWINSEEPLTLACSHGDWIPLALHYLVGTRTELKKGAWAEITLKDKTPQLRWLLQEL